jgi:hypothetical protein
MERERIKDFVEMPAQERFPVEFVKPVGLVAQHGDQESP